MTDLRGDQLSTVISEPKDNAGLLQKKLLEDIDRLNRSSIRGILALSLFILISIFAWWGFSFLPSPESVTAVLGKPPSAYIISIALIIYTFSAIILSLARMSTGVEHRSSFCHVGYLTAFFLFYYFGKSLDENYWAVFGSGMTILGVESYRIWTYCAENISRIKEDIEFVSRTGRPPPED
jgi:hypothetical protein